MTRRPSRLAAACAALAIAFAMAAAPVASHAQDSDTPSLEYQVKASMLFNFLQFVDWPPDSLKGPPVLALGVIGDDHFGKTLDVIDGEIVGGRTVVVRRMKKFDAATAAACHVIFVCKSERERAASILSALEGKSILTVGESPGFLDAGGMINFVVDGERLRFEINRAAERQAHLVISSKLLRLATVVRPE
ncbi:MAG TPA: YfiR family protein [Kiritimatiellia bacterium]|jgi:hypothetical protein